MSRSSTATSRRSPISSKSSPSAVASSIAISSNPAQTSTGGPSRSCRPNQPETVSLHHFVAKADWSDEALLALVRAQVLPAIERQGPILAWVVDDTGFPD